MAAEGGDRTGPEESVGSTVKIGTVKEKQGQLAVIIRSWWRFVLMRLFSAVQHSSVCNRKH